VPPCLQRDCRNVHIQEWNLLSLNEIEDKLGNLWPGNEDMRRRRLIALKVIPEGQSDLDDKASNPLEQDYNNGNLGSDSGISDTTDSGLGKDTEIELCGGIGSLGSRSNGL
jgi:hypothetical protein